MRIGEKVTGVPENPDLRKAFPTVTGFYDEETWDAMGETVTTQFVMVGDIAVDCNDIRKATRREKETVLP
jgi:hypothetical protein